MAESAISYVAQSLSNLLVQKAEFLRGVCGQVEWLRDELQRMQCFLKEADAKQEDDERVHNWVTEIRNAAYDAEDIVDTFVLKIESWRRRGFIKRYGHIFKEILDLREVGNEIEAFRAKISDISRSCETYGIKSIGEGTSSSRERLRQLRRSSPRGVDKDIIGMENDVVQLVAQLLKMENQLVVIPLVGMGGIGKTTLARKVFNHGVVRGNFHCLAWIYVSQEFRPKDILLGIIREVIRPTKELQDMMDNLQEEELERMLYEHLQEKQYLVVLDDIWTTEAWDLLKRAFPDTGNNSKVMLTTRNRDVALHTNAHSAPYELCLLSKEESWELFLRKAFLDGNCPQEFEDIGRTIVEKCDGLPWAIVVVGGLLSRKSLVSEWERVLNNINSHFAKGQNGVFATLALSYIDLPHYLKSCFLHLSLFPEDFVISTSKLVQLWIAEGLIPQREERMEVIAEEYLNELIDRNMIQVVRTSASKRVKQCRIHDVLRDLSVLKAKEEIFMEIHGETFLLPSTKSRHQSVHSNFDRYFASKPSIPRLRSLLLFHPFDPAGSMLFLHFDMICASFKLLRVLDLENMLIRYLRKLGVAVYSGSDLKTFFNSIAELEHLVSLRLGSVDADLHLPSLSELSLLHSVTKLRLEGRISELPVPQEFPPKITQLTLQGSFLMLNPMNVLQHLPKLSILRLRKHSYTGEQMKISAGKFPQLKFLELEGLDALQELTIENGAMPRLRHFRISTCRELKELPVGIMSATTLQELEIIGMPSAFENKLQGDDSHKVKHVPDL